MSVAIQFDSVSKKFTLHYERARSFQELAVGLFRRNNGSREEFWALRDVSFTVEKGETVGIIGPNGAGKSTVLKLIARIIEPTSGRIAVRGRIGALLELGAGFHPDLTGRENIYLSGSILGLSRAEIRRRLDDIVGFAELERFIDIPVKHYSSGMYVRLGFSVAIHTNPEILLVDEVLAVGDQAFQAKCMKQISQLKQSGLTIVLVSHNLEIVQWLCDRVIWLDQGHVVAEGVADQVINAYLANMTAKEEAWLAAQHEGQRSRWGSGEVAIVGVRFLDANGKERRVFVSGETMRVRIRYRAMRRVERPVFGVAIYRSDGVHVNGPNTRLSDFDIDWIEGEGEIDYVIERLPLLEGSYDLSVAVYDWECLYPYDHQHRRYKFLVQGGGVKEKYGLVYIPSYWEHRRL